MKSLLAALFLAATLHAQPLVLAGGRLIDGYGGPPLDPGYEEDGLQMIRERNATLYWTPTLEGLFLFEQTKQNPERIDDQYYFRLVPRRIPMLPAKFKQLRDAGVTILVGTDSGIPLTDMTSMRHIVHVVKDGRVYK